MGKHALTYRLRVPLVALLRTPATGSRWRKRVRVDWVLRWPRWLLLVAGVFTLWAGSAAAIMLTTLNLNSPMDMPTAHFLAPGEGKVLDMGEGTGRSAIMVLENRSKTTVVALDLFTEQ